MRTVAEMLRWRARQHPDRIALTFEGRGTSYRELDEGSNRVANALIAAGVRCGDRVCVLDKSHDVFFEVLFGIAKAGGVFTPVNWRLAPPEIAYMLNDAEAPIAFIGAEFADAVASVESDLVKTRCLVRFGEGPSHWPAYEEFRDAAPGSDPRGDTAEDETVWQLYTSGTTGNPKGAELTNSNLVDTLTACVVGFGAPQEGDVALICMPLYHIAGSGYALSMFYAGARLVVMREADPTEILKAIPREPVNYMLLVPALMNFLLQQPSCKETDFSSLKSIVYGASPIPEDLLAACIETFGCDFVQAYGLTETTGAAVLLSPEEHVIGNPRLAACGLPSFGNEIRVISEDGTDCAPGVVGEIAMRGRHVMKGYWNRPDATRDSIRDDWFYSGDAGYLDEDGFLYIHDRVKDMIVSGGENIYPAEIESVLFGHDAIADVAVIGVPDEKWGETVKAVVVPKPGVQVDEREIVDFCQGRIAGYKRPRSVDFIDELPRNPTGKILKRELRKKYWEGRDREVN